MIKAGQIYSYRKIGNFVVSNVDENGEISRIWQDGSVDVVDAVRWDGKIHGIFIAEYPNWRAAVCSAQKSGRGQKEAQSKKIEKDF